MLEETNNDILQDIRDGVESNDVVVTSGSITANAGTDLNTSELATESTASASAASLNGIDGSTSQMSTQMADLLQGSAFAEVVSSDGTPAGGNSILVSGVDGNGDAQTIATNTSGDVNVGVVANLYRSRSDTFTVAGNGTTVNASSTPLKHYSVQVKGTGAAASAWEVRLEASLDGVNFSQVLQHITSTGDGAILWATTPAPSLYFRSRCVSVTLGSATNLIVTILGVE
jgi:hypothetical protein